MTPIQITNVDPHLLRANRWNTNVGSPDNERKLQESLKRFGLFKPILARTLSDGSLEVIGGEHRWQAAVSLGYTTVPVVNLGQIEDKKAKEISLVDNGRYGNDDALELADLLSEIGADTDITTFMPYDSTEMERLFASVQTALDDLEIDEDDLPPPVSAAAKPRQEFQIMRFKVPVDDVAKIQDVIDRIMKEQRFTEEDSLTNAGHALVHLVSKEEK